MPSPRRRSSPEKSAPNLVRLIRVFVSSPSDVKEEWQAINEVVATINRTDGDAGSFRLETLQWTKDVVTRLGGRPQEIVNEQTPYYDIFVGIMATRFGQPTGTHPSGTEEEFRAAYSRYEQTDAPWIAFYFRDQVIPGTNLDALQQYVKVCEFRKELETKGLVQGYVGVNGDAQSFRAKIDEHLRKIVKLLPATAVKSTSKSPRKAKAPKPSNVSKVAIPTQPSGPPVRPAEYLRRLRDECAGVELLGLRLQHGQSVRLNSVYVPLTTPAATEPAATKKKRNSVADDRERPPQLLLDLLANESLYVAGPAGSGKSTFCRWVAWLACAGEFPEIPVAPPKGYQEGFPAAFRDRLPLLVRLRDFWRDLPQTPGSRALRQQELEAALARWVDAKRPAGITWNEVEPHLAAGSLLLLLDGVDEVPLSAGDARQPCPLRAALVEGIADAAREWTRRGNRVLLTSRPYGLSEDEVRKLPLRAAPLADLDSPLQKLLIQRWFRCLDENPESADSTARQMTQHIASREDLTPLTANPMLLTAVCIVYHQGGRLPQDRYDLYDRIVDNVLFNRFPEDRGTVDRVRNRLAVVAYGMHTGVGLGDSRETPQAEATLAEIDKLIGAYQHESLLNEPSYTNAIDAREQLLTHTGLLLPQAGKQAGFYHLTIQDFFAAQRLLARHEEELEQEFRRRGAVENWRSTLNFVFGSLVSNRKLSDRSARLLGELIDGLNEESVALAVVVADCVQILLKRGWRLKADVEERFKRYCLSAIEREIPVRPRNELALVLGHLGDSRIVVDLRQGEGYVPIPAGRYRIGDPPRNVKIAAGFALSKYPVTNSQFALFIKENGYQDRQWWSDEGWAWRVNNSIELPAYWHDGKWNGPNQPVVGVSYWEAEAFAAWAGGRLPTEDEWEAAARGPDGFEYPWGNEWENGNCNSTDSGLQMTSAVGIFPPSRTRDTLLDDMAGNVWEWCASVIFGSGRVIEGGSWDAVADYWESMYSMGRFPEDRDDNQGFRLASRSVQEQAERRRERRHGGSGRQPRPESP